MRGIWFQHVDIDGAIDRLDQQGSTSARSRGRARPPRPRPGAGAGGDGGRLPGGLGDDRASLGRDDGPRALAPRWPAARAGPRRVVASSRRCGTWCSPPTPGCCACCWATRRPTTRSACPSPRWRLRPGLSPIPRGPRRDRRDRRVRESRFAVVRQVLADLTPERLDSTTTPVTGARLPHPEAVRRPPGPRRDPHREVAAAVRRARASPCSSSAQLAEPSGNRVGAAPGPGQRCRHRLGDLGRLARAGAGGRRTSGGRRPPGRRTQARAAGRSGRP